MGFFNEIGKKTSEATSKITKETKLKLKINDNKNKIEDIYEEIGKKVYEKHVREENINIKADLEEQCTKIDVLASEIEEILNQIRELKDKKQCENCYAEIDINDRFCPECGAEQEMPKEEPAREVEVLEKKENNNEGSENESIEDVVKTESIGEDENKEELN